MLASFLLWKGCFFGVLLVLLLFFYFIDSNQIKTWWNNEKSMQIVKQKKHRVLLKRCCFKYSSNIHWFDWIQTEKLLSTEKTTLRTICNNTNSLNILCIWTLILLDRERERVLLFAFIFFRMICLKIIIKPRNVCFIFCLIRMWFLLCFTAKKMFSIEIHLK